MRPTTLEKMLSMLRPILLLLMVAAMPAAARTLKDMAGDAVTVPDRVERVATIGPIPVLNSLVFAIGEQRRIVNGLGPFAKRPQWKFQFVFAPQIASQPSLQNPDNTPNIEQLLDAAPDVVLTMNRMDAERLRAAGVSAMYLAWRRPEDVKAAVQLLGQLLGRPDASDRYSRRFDEILERVARTLQQKSQARPRVLYMSPATLTQPHLVAEWWIRAAGGQSVTDDGRSIESRSFTMEQVLAWDPDILIVPSRDDLDALRREPRFSGLKAVRSGRLFVAPCGAHTWGNRTSEQPLTVLWAAAQFHPSLFAHVDLVAEMRRFYLDLFGVALSQAQAQQILSGDREER